MPGLGVWTMDPRPGADLADLVALGAGVPDSAVEERRLLADLDSVATIVYTSGTTAAPKGALITHGNFVGQVLNVAAAYTGVVREDGNTIIFLPMAHVLARGLQLTCLANGMRIAHLSDPRDVVPALGALKPTFLVVVPRVLQKIHAPAAAAATKKHLGPVWASAQRTAVAWGRFAEARDADPAVQGRTRPAGQACALRPSLLRPAPDADGRTPRLPALRCRSARRRAVPLLPRPGPAGHRGLRPHGNNRPADREYARIDQGLARWASRCRAPPCVSRTTARCSPAASASSPATAGRPTTRTRLRTGSSAPATSASSMSRAGSPSGPDQGRHRHRGRQDRLPRHLGRLRRGRPPRGTRRHGRRRANPTSAGSCCWTRNPSRPGRNARASPTGRPADPRRRRRRPDRRRAAPHRNRQCGQRRQREDRGSEAGAPLLCSCSPTSARPTGS